MSETGGEVLKIEEQSQDIENEKLWDQFAKNKKVEEILSYGKDINTSLNLIPGLGITDEREATYVNLLSGKEVITDQRIRRRRSEIPGYEVSDEVLLAGRKLGLGKLHKRDIEGEELYLKCVDLYTDAVGKSIGKNREKMIRFAIHHLVSRDFYEQRMSEDYVYHLKNNPEIKFDNVDLERDMAYWKEQIANASAEKVNTP